MALIAFHGKEEVKQLYVDRVKQHRAADEIVQAFGYWKNDRRTGTFKGCAVGCTLHSGDHNAYETELGVPRVLAYLEDSMFERMAPERAMEWPTQFLEAIPVGADLSGVSSEFILWLLVDEKEGIGNFGVSDSVKAKTLEVAALFQRRVAGDEPTDAQWSAVYGEIWSDLSDLSALRALSDLSDLSDLSALSDLSDPDYKISRGFAALCGDKLLTLLAAAPVAEPVPDNVQ